MWFKSCALKHNIVSKRKCFRGASLTPKEYADTSKGLQCDKTANNYCPECGFRLLECAIRNQHTDMIELLLKNGAEIFRDNDIGRGIETMDALVKLGYKEVEGEFLYTSSSVGRFNVWATFSVKNRGIAIFYGGKSRMNVQGKEPDVYFAWGKATFKQEGSVLRIKDGLETSLLEPAEPPYLGSKEIFYWFCNQLNEAIGLGSVVDDGFDLSDIEMALKASLDHFGQPSSQPSMAVGLGSVVDDGFDLSDIEMALKASLDHFGQPSLQPSAPPLPEDACTICFDHRVDTAFVPCGHLICSPCAEKIQHQNLLCPFCHEVVENFAIPRI
ncbi:putative Zinc finger, RING/FYVE/PHD-type, ankyrin repeat-containing domain-containing protein [Rosa chinensis]|uniref:Putative Zinc finger, RING/FYVE/PHD-type, ankyrin repeat-containing domain-containing protein n=2 Tax=Rosa chinensis TaxID=74649 RepID=A0A2P6R6U3_ROSCH|nr:uncharacterized protein LOC112194884 isoform X1 [Rosa chinensis]PRQ42141.1 putative Zinc finger, RING/FYVE/PHD-type, ankyrin repeat-containing domain-containing protein [Rosa chinensis]